MNVYDFDKTIYNGDCTQDFVFYCLKKYPKCLLAFPKMMYYGSLYLLKIINKTQFKEKVYTFLKYIPHIEDECDVFVSLNKCKIKTWYLEQQEKDDLIISASPEFLIKRFCNEIGIKHWMASVVDVYSGKYTGENCYGEEKVKRFDNVYQRSLINKFYSDSYSDNPLAVIAKEAYLVQGDELKEW